jgi:hypothetical protein
MLAKPPIAGLPLSLSPTTPQRAATSLRGTFPEVAANQLSHIAQCRICWSARSVRRPNRFITLSLHTAHYQRR